MTLPEPERPLEAPAGCSRVECGEDGCERGVIVIEGDEDRVDKCARCRREAREERFDPDASIWDNDR